MSKQLCDKLDPYERETVVNASDGDGLVRILTHQRREIARLRKHPGVTETGTGYHGSTEWGEFTIPAERWSAGGGIKRKAPPPTEKQLQALKRQGRTPGTGGLSHRAPSPTGVVQSETPL